MVWTDDPVSDANCYFEELDKAQEERDKSTERCDCCGEPIRQETAFRFRGYWVCNQCLGENEDHENDMYERTGY